MMIRNRYTQILEILSKNTRADVTTLAELMEVSQVTVRKDLDNLEKRGLICRKHGYACLQKTDDIGNRISLNYDIKRRIAKAAAGMVEEGETVMIESGSCCALLAEELALERKDVTIITNSVYITHFLRNAPHINIILLGGCFQPASQVVVGPLTRKYGEVFFSDKFFVGTNGLMPDYGFTGRDFMRSQTVMDLAEYARYIFVLTDAEKFSRQGVLGTLRFEKVTGVFTDSRIPAEYEQLLIDKNVVVNKVAERE
jgi:DeoR/GlpR family transcriptional regulator of sugar metabolism